MTHRLTAALSGEDVNVVDGETDGSGDGSGSGSGDSGDNEITDSPTEEPTTEGNSIDEDDNMLGGGVSKDGDVLGNRDGKNSGQTSKAMNGLLLTMVCLVYFTRWY